MRVFAALFVVAIGLLIGRWWTREPTPAKPAAVSKVQGPVTQVRVPPHLVHGHLVPPVLTQQVRPSLVASDPDPERHKHQDVLWQRLRRFATDAQLTDQQWEQFEYDVSELATIESAAWAKGVSEGFDGITELSRELDQELLVRAAGYMTVKQIAVLRYYFPAALVTQVRRLHYIPTILPGS